ncbi:MAG: hypothetical protein R3D26_18465 [Cyanobacteriota/Melainabacteria group bacterium]
MSDQAEKQKLKEIQTSPDDRVEQQASRAGSDQAQAEMPTHQRQANEKKSQFEQAALSASPRSHVSETFGRLQMEDDGQVLVKGVAAGTKRAEHTKETRQETGTDAENLPEDITESTAHIRKLIVSKPDDRELQVLADNYQVVNQMDEGQVKDHLKEAIVNAARKHSADLDELYQKRESSAKSPAELLAEHNASFNPDNLDHAGDSLPAVTSEQAVRYRIGERGDGGMLIESGITRQDYQNSYQNEWQAFTELPPDYQRKVIEIFQNGSNVGQQAIHETADDILQKTAQGYIDAVKVPLDIVVMAGKGLLSVLEFERDLIFNPEQAQQNAAVAGEHIGKALVAGVKLWTGFSGYAADVQQNGDYGRPFQDLGNALNKWYDGLTPGDQMGTMANISAGFGIGAAAGQFKNLAKPGAFAQFLEEAASAVPKNPEAQAKAAETIRKLIETMSSKHGGMQPALAGEAGILTGPNAPGLVDQIKDAGKGLKDKWDELVHKMEPHKPSSEGEFRHANPIDRTAVTQEKIAQLQRLSKENEPLVREFTDSIDTRYGTQSKVSFKDPADIAEKASRPSIKSDRPWFDVEHVRDALRFKTVLQDLRDLPRLIEDLKKSGFEIIKCDAEKLIKPKGRGWRMAAFDLKAPNGQIIEYQILPPEMERAGALEHQIYKQWRGKDVGTLSPAERTNALRADVDARKLYKQAWSQYLERTGQTNAAVKDVLEQVNKRLGE